MILEFFIFIKFFINAFFVKKKSRSGPRENLQTGNVLAQINFLHIPCSVVAGAAH
jgi:hypothetical protein